MPIYQYYEIFPDGSEGEPFDVSQKINEPTLKVHPITGNSIKKYFSAPSINTEYSDKKTKKQLDPSNLQQHVAEGLRGPIVFLSFYQSIQY